MRSSRAALLSITLICIIFSTELEAQFSRRSKVVRAIRRSNVERVQTLLTDGTVRTNRGHFNRNTLIGEVISSNADQNKKAEMISYLIKLSRADINEEMYIGDYEDSHPLTAAISKNELDLARKLIDMGAYVHVMDENNRSPLSETINILRISESNGDHANALKAVKLSEYIVESFSWSLTTDPAITDDDKAYEIYRQYVDAPINECIKGIWPEVLEPIIGSVMADKELVLEVLKRTIQAPIKKTLKAEFMNTINSELIKRQIDVDNVTLTNEQGLNEKPMEMVARLDDAGSFVGLREIGADMPSLALAEKHNAKAVTKLIYDNTMKVGRVISMLSKYNFGWDSSDFDEQMNAAISKMVLFDEYKIGDKELDLFFGEKNEFGVRAGGIFDYCIENISEGNNWAYAALIGVLCYESSDLRSERYITRTIIKGFRDTGIINLDSWLITEKLKTNKYVLPGLKPQFMRTLDIIKGAKVPAVKGAIY